MIRNQLVKSLSELQEEQKFSVEFIETVGLRLRRGSLIEIVGAQSSGKTSLMLTIISPLTRNGEVCAIVDVTDSFDPQTALLNGMNLENLLWVKCGGDLEKALVISDYLVQAKGFGAIWLNLNFVESNQLRFIPSSYWYRFRAGVRGCPTLLLVTVKQSVLGTACKQSFLVERGETVWEGAGRFKLLREFAIKLHSRKSGLVTPLICQLPLVYKDV